MIQEIQDLIDKANNLRRIRTSIEVLRELEMYQNTNPIYTDDENSVSTYMMYKDLHAVERILLNEYGDDLGRIYWTLYKYIQNTVQEFLFEEIFPLRKLSEAVHLIEVLEPASQYSDLRWFEFGINYIEKREIILEEFDRMLDWIDDQIIMKYFPTQRKAYNSEFLKK